MAVAESQRQLPGSFGLIMCPDRPTNLPPEIKHVPIRPMGYLEYSWFIIYALHQFIDTDWCLVVQEDGWVLDGRNWSDAYWNYDYIGAPTHAALFEPLNGPAQYLRRFDWVDRTSEAGRLRLVMNGGFSLRSKRLLRAPAALRIPFCLSPMVAEHDGTHFALTSPDASHAEDFQLCVPMRQTLEGAGIRFPPVAASRAFAVEHHGGSLHDGFDFRTVLGHHSTVRRITALNPLSMQYQVRGAVFNQIAGEDAIRSLFLALGYCVSLMS